MSHFSPICIIKQMKWRKGRASNYVIRGQSIFYVFICAFILFCILCLWFASVAWSGLQWSLCVYFLFYCLFIGRCISFYRVPQFLLPSFLPKLYVKISNALKIIAAKLSGWFWCGLDGGRQSVSTIISKVKFLR